MSAEEVRLVVGVEPKQGAQGCPSNPATPVTIDLPEPIGDRAVAHLAIGFALRGETDLLDPFSRRGEPTTG